MGTSVIGPYQILRKLGQGSTASVYLAYDKSIERQIAVKIYDPRFTHDPAFKNRFTKEASILTSLEHDAIVPVYDFGIVGDWPYIAMRYMSGGSLANRLEQGAFSLEESYRILQRIAAALDMAHHHQVIHRDLKPKNILFDADNQPYLTDFGMARVAEETMSDQQTTVFGAPAYMSPEQVKGHAKVDGRADIYGLGCILFEMLTGQPPFQGETNAQIMVKHASELIPNVCTLNPDLPPTMNDVFQTALAKDPADRFDSASALTSAFYQQIIGDVHSSPGRTGPGPTRPEPVSLVEQSLASHIVKTAVDNTPLPGLHKEFFNRTNTFLLGGILFLITFIFWALSSLDLITWEQKPESALPQMPTVMPVNATSESPVVAVPAHTATATVTPQPTSAPTVTPTATATALLPQGRLVFVSNRDGVDSLYLISLSSPDQPEKLTGIDSSEFDDWWPSWCGPNTIVFERGSAPSTNRTGQDLRSIRTDVISYGQTFVSTTGANQMPGVPSCSQSGEMVAYSLQVDASNFAVGWAPFDIQSGRISATFNLFDQGFAHGGHVSWSSDNRHVVLMSRGNNSSNPYHLYWVDRESSDPVRQITAGFSSSNLYPDLSPDSQQVAYACLDRSRGFSVWGLCITSVEKPTPVLLKPDLHPTPFPSETNAFSQPITPSWSPDGEWLAYASDKDGDWDIYLLHLATNYEENLTRNWAGSDEKHPSWGP